MFPHDPRTTSSLCMARSQRGIPLCGRTRALLVLTLLCPSALLQAQSVSPEEKVLETAVSVSHAPGASASPRDQPITAPKGISDGPDTPASPPHEVGAEATGTTNISIYGRTGQLVMVVLLGAVVLVGVFAFLVVSQR